MNATTVKGACPLCAGHVEMEAEMIGQAMSCPHCGKEVAFRPLAWAADLRSAEEEAGNGTEGTEGAIAGAGTQTMRPRFRFLMGFGLGAVVGAVLCLAGGFYWAVQSEARQREQRAQAEARVRQLPAPEPWTPVTQAEMTEAIRLIPLMNARFDPFTKRTTFGYRLIRHSETIHLQVGLDRDNTVGLDARVQQSKYQATLPTTVLFECGGVVRSARVAQKDLYQDSEGVAYEMALCEADDLAKVMEAAARAEVVRARMTGVRSADVELKQGQELVDLRATVLVYRAARMNPGILAEAARKAERGEE